MKDYSSIFNADATYIDKMYSQFKMDPTSVEDGWRSFFSGFEFAGDSKSSIEEERNGKMEVSTAHIQKEINVIRLISGYRDRAHLLSDTNPVRVRKDRKPKLELEDYQLSESDLQTRFQAAKVLGMNTASLADILHRLRLIYCGHIGFEVNHIDSKERRVWLRERIENRNLSRDFGLSDLKKRRIMKMLNGSEIFEKFLHTKYVGQKRFSLEGGESTIPGLDSIINAASISGVKEIAIGMAHRGRLNVLANIMGKTYDNIFAEFEGNVPEQVYGDGDVKYHLGFSSIVETLSGQKMHLKLAPNPSHLETVGPVVSGFVRAKADILYDSEYDKILPIIIHGDAAVAGQGVVYELGQMSQLPGYLVGGSIHFVINNQIGFTTNFEDARSSTYSTGVANMIQAPVFHVNGDDPEAVVFVCELAVEYRQKFNRDVYIDMVCYRKHGHNEGDDPKFTQPFLYKKISEHNNPRELYLKELLDRDEIDEKLAKEEQENFWNQLQERLDMAKQKVLPYKYQEPELAWKKLKKRARTADLLNSPKTGISKKAMDTIIDKLIEIPEGFTPLSKVNRLIKGKNKLLAKNQLDWGLAELLAYGSILIEGSDVRMSGQDVKRGTFSHRHAIFTDAETYGEYNRLSELAKDQGKFRIYNSLLSEFSVLGFEYGYGMSTPESLVVWEAQFGDFYNGAQPIVDQYISAGESKWGRMNGIVMLLPHGYEGQGPEHSSTRIERFLQLCAENNMVVCNITTPANFFHVIRRQLKWAFRKPLIIASPKSLLRHPKCVSDISDFKVGNKFMEIIDDPTAKSSSVKSVLLCSGKIYYDLLAKQESDNRKDVAIVRFEQLYPFAQEQFDTIRAKYKKASFTWVQEESENMGPWTYLLRYFRRLPIEVISRKRSSSPASGFKKVSDKQQMDIVDRAFKV